MFVLRDIDGKKILDYTISVLQVGFGTVLIVIKDHKILDIIPSPRIRIEEELEETIQSGSFNGRMDR